MKYGLTYGTRDLRCERLIGELDQLVLMPPIGWGDGETMELWMRSRFCE